MEKACHLKLADIYFASHEVLFVIIVNQYALIYLIINK